MPQTSRWSVNIEHISAEGSFLTRSHLTVAKNVLTEVFRDTWAGDIWKQAGEPFREENPALLWS